MAALIASAVAGAAQSPVTVTIAPAATGPEIPADFVGLSFETGSLAYNSPRVQGYLLDPANKQLLTLFHNLGVRNLRIGGDSVDSEAGGMPSTKDIDVLFRFAKAADVNVIYSLRLVKGDPAQDAAAARYIWKKYHKRLVCFSIGNEPNLYHGRDPQITDEASFDAKWKRFANAVSAAVPEAKYGGPDNGTAGTSWAQAFEHQQAGSTNTPYIFAHLYLGNRKQDSTPALMIDHMLSPDWLAKYQAYYEKVGAPALAAGFQYRITEMNSYVADFPGVWGGNNSFATALFVLDCMHWWAEHGIHGVNFHTVLKKYNGTVYTDEAGTYQVYPMASGIRAFSEGARGKVNPVTIGNPEDLNLTAYAVRGEKNTVLITIVNKEHGASGRSARVAVNGLFGGAANAAAMSLTAPGNDAAATSGILLGGTALSNSIKWVGRWWPLGREQNGSYLIDVPASSAAIVRIQGE